MRRFSSSTYEVLERAGGGHIKDIIKKDEIYYLFDDF